MRILIVEDEKKVAQFLKKGLLAEAFSVDTAGDGQEALRMIDAGEYDAIILDIMLPRLDGIQVLRRLRASGADTPVLMLTSKSDLQDRVEGLNLGADDYLAKPFAFSEVLARLRAILRRKSTDAQTSVLQIADLRMDLIERTVDRGGRRIDLTNKEFELLEYLLRNKRRVLSRVILMEHIWDMHFDSETNIVDVVVNRLRRKVDDPFPARLIQTVRGVGYTLREAEEDDTQEA